MNKNQFEQWKQMVDENSERNLDDIIDASLDQAQKEEKRKNIFKGAGTIFSTILVFTLMVNFSNSFYVFAQEVPVLREISSLLRFAEYKKETMVVPNKPIEPEKPSDIDKPTNPQESNDSKSVNFDVGYMSGMVTSMSPIDITVNEYGPKGVDGINYYPTGPYKDGWIMKGYEVNTPAISTYDVDYIFESPTDIYKILPKMNPIDPYSGGPIDNLIPSVQKLIDDYPYVVPFGNSIYAQMIVINDKTYFVYRTNKERDESAQTHYLTVVEYDITQGSWRAHGIFDAKAYPTDARIKYLEEHNGKPYLTYDRNYGDATCNMFHAIDADPESGKLDCFDGSASGNVYTKPNLVQKEENLRVYSNNLIEPTYFFQDDNPKESLPGFTTSNLHVYTDDGYKYSFSEHYNLKIVGKYLLLAHEDLTYRVINTETDMYDTFTSLSEVQKWLNNKGIEALLVNVSSFGDEFGIQGKFAQTAWPNYRRNDFETSGSKPNPHFILIGDGKPYRIISGSEAVDDWREIVITPRK
ncbi:hypothetical protein G7062_04510 [Erysipelothrix sp. HDW6C]|uniref:hypothetical protein n=1 Tax=Erysipelothrix sp. HDW6C TaxID=2714930 RepID=UPI0014078E00|nr:hypothetical protein [Erysipelothrix sp. HDW6C]QIK69603.1 hypothetical protein G7062_04510 [Erysipelothrix sp. HDW6C]